jgi:hypothetical protein
VFRDKVYACPEKEAQRKDEVSRFIFILYLSTSARM